MKTEKQIYYPLFASATLSGGVQPDQELNQVWEQMRKLSNERRSVLLSVNIAEKISQLEELYGLPDRTVEAIVVYIRQLFFSLISEAIFAQKIAELLTGNDRKNEILNFIQNDVLTVPPDSEEVEEISTVPLRKTASYPLLEAMSKFPRLGQQLITENKLKLKSQAEPVRPSLTNWLKVYRDELGIGFHDNIKRADFLYQSYNTKPLSEEEKNRISILVKALEDDELVAIDPENQEIVFSGKPLTHKQPVASKVPPNTKAASPNVAAPVPDLFERFQNIQTQSHTLPSDLSSVGTNTFQNAPSVQMEKQAKEVQKPIQHSSVQTQKQATPPPAPIPPKPPQATPAAPIAIGKVSFSSKQVFPGEKVQRKSSTSQMPQGTIHLQTPSRSPSEPLAKLFLSGSALSEHRIPTPVSTPSQRPQPASPKPVPPKLVPQRKTPPQAEKTTTEEVVSQNMFRIKPSKY